MSAHSNEFGYAREFNGNLRAESDLVPVKVTTRLRVMSEHTASEVRRYSSQVFNGAPQYVIGGGNLPLHPSLQAMGRHYFTW